MTNLAIVLQWISHPLVITFIVISALVIVALKRRSDKPALPATATKTRRGVVAKTILVRMILVGLLIPYAYVTFSLPRDTESTYLREQLPNASSGILLVDVSGSIGEKNKIAILRIFDEAVERKLNLGLVIFAGDGYLAWGPNVPAEESLVNMRRYFEVDEDGRPIVSEPWEIGGGTQMYEGLLDALAAQNILAEHGAPKPPIILISDLQDYAKSKAMVIEEFVRMRSEGIPVWIINIGANSDTPNRTDVAEAPFIAVLGKDAIVRDLSSLNPVLRTGELSNDSATLHMSTEVFGVIVVIALFIILLDAFFLPRLPLKKISERRER